MGQYVRGWAISVIFGGRSGISHWKLYCVIKRYADGLLSSVCSQVGLCVGALIFLPVGTFEGLSQFDYCFMVGVGFLIVYCIT